MSNIKDEIPTMNCGQLWELFSMIKHESEELVDNKTFEKIKYGFYADFDIRKYIQFESRQAEEEYFDKYTRGGQNRIPVIRTKRNMQKHKFEVKIRDGKEVCNAPAWLVRDDLDERKAYMRSFLIEHFETKKHYKVMSSKEDI
jgi:hypothetical protein